GLPLKSKRESEKAIMVPRRDRIDVWWNLATVPWRTKKPGRKTGFVLDGTDNLIDALPWPTVPSKTSAAKAGILLRHFSARVNSCPFSLQPGTFSFTITLPT
ncbi:MAG TPA: hypothetical protein VFL79_10620, partial [Terriglobia bacterium]|nr:hypothetical protein [Terriglobia bacterium]